MGSEHTTDISINLAIVYLKNVGIWFAANRKEKYLRYCMSISAIVSISILLGLQIRGLFFCKKDVTMSIAFTCQGVASALCFFKLCIVFMQKRKFLQLVEFMQKNFWHSNYDIHEEQILADAKKMCVYLVCFFSFSLQITNVCYIMKPGIVNIGKNPSDRIFIFPMWLNESWNESPYYEILYVIQGWVTFQCSISYLCFDNMFCIICLHLAGQFRVLQYRMTSIHKIKDTCLDEEDSNKNALYLSDACLVALKDCIRHHQALTGFCKSVDEVVGVIMLFQVIIFSSLVCLSGYETFVVTMNFSSRINFTAMLITSMIQLWMFTYSCSRMTNESIRVTPAAYRSPWIHLSMDNNGKMVRRDVQFVMMRSSRACYVNAWRFCPISLETYTTIMSTAMSYFTVLRQSTLDPADT